MATEKSARKGGRQRRGNTAKDLPPDLFEMYKSDPEESYNQRKTRMDSKVLGGRMVQVQICNY